MARRLIGLDIGTNAVRVAEIEAGDQPRVITFGQVALPPDVMREGEVVDAAAVTAAIQRLWKELGLGRADVRVGIASPRVLVRTFELQAMPDSDLEGALRLQAQDLIPIPLDDAVLDFQVIETSSEGLGGSDADTDESGAKGAATSRVLLAAAHKDMVSSLVGAVSAAGLRVSAVDLVPLALIRSIGSRMESDSDEVSGGAEAIVSVGGGVTIVAVHEAGVPRFVRILGVAGRSLTDAISRDLAITVDEAETLKRQGSGATPDLAQRAASAMDRPLADLVEQVRGSLDYYRTQPDSARLMRISLTGGGSLTPGLPDRLGNVLGLPVELAEPRSHFAIGDIGFPQSQLPALDPFLPAPVGLALGGLATGKRINLLGAEGRAALDRAKFLRAGAAVAAVLVLLLGGLWWLRKSSAASERDKVAAIEESNRNLTSRIAALSDAAEMQSQIDVLRANTSTLVATDISWARMLQEIARTIPSDSWLTAFTGTSIFGLTSAGAEAPVQSVAGSAAGGNATFTVMGLDFPSVSAWIQRISTIPSFTDLWVPTATKGSSTTTATDPTSSSTVTSGGRPLVSYSSDAVITAAAQSDRLALLDRETR
ncbi:MAG: type IV pilus assembly protein PilM [Acidimicrobiia bacterium]|nr:type IV pilus assembly protein PilM [Acidimicrobiia bacterium]